MKDLKDILNESLDPANVINEAKMKAEGPFYDAGETQHMSVSANQRNVGLYTLYDTFIGCVDIIETKDIEAYMMDCGYKQATIDAVTGLKPGYSYSQGDEYIWTCLEEC